jgi:hypothetical protein
MKPGKLTALLGAAVLLFALRASADDSADLRAEIAEIKQQLAQMDDLKARLAEMEKKLAERDKAQKESAPTSVSTGYPGDKVKLDGRVFLGIFDTGAQGPARYWGTDIPDAKFRMTFIPSERTTFVARLSANNTSVSGFDYFYLDYAKVPFPGGTLRLGQRKLEVGLDTLTDNPEENMVIMNSASHVSGYATGVSVFGKVGQDANAPSLAVGFANGPKGVMIRPTNGLPFNVRLSGPLPKNLYAAASWYDSGTLRGDDLSAVNVAEIASAPPGAVNWRRTLWDFDLRYGYGPTGVRPMIPMIEPPKLMIGASAGMFQDTATGAPDRDGTFWYTEGLMRLSPKVYMAARYSRVKLENGVLAHLTNSPVPVNSYARTSIGLGYLLSDLTQLKTEYTFNDASGGASKPSLNQWAVGVASKF